MDFECYCFIFAHLSMGEVKNSSRRRQEVCRLSQAKSAVVSQVISATIDAGFIKADEAVGGSKKYARYVPSWA
jgi:hypothetical protein